MAMIPMGMIPSHYARIKGNDALCLTYPDGELTWSQLESRTNRRANMFQALGVRKDNFITVALQNGIMFHEICFALWKLGATPHIVSHRLPSVELKAILELLKPAAFVSKTVDDVPHQR